jgi:hypothetical protein
VRCFNDKANPDMASRPTLTAVAVLPSDLSVYLRNQIIQNAATYETDLFKERLSTIPVYERISWITDYTKLQNINSVATSDIHILYKGIEMYSSK